MQAPSSNHSFGNPGGSEYLFVYGLLMRGMPFHHLLDNSRFIAPAITLSEWKLLVLPGGMPVMQQGGRTAVKGELYRDVDFSKIDDMDEDFDRYQIQCSTVYPHGNGVWYNKVETYALRTPERAKGAVDIPSGSFRSYVGEREVKAGGIPHGHALPKGKRRLDGGRVYTNDDSFLILGREI